MNNASPCHLKWHDHPEYAESPLTQALLTPSSHAGYMRSSSFSAGVAKLAYAADSKSAGVHSPWGFKSLLRHSHSASAVKKSAYISATRVVLKKAARFRALSLYSFTERGSSRYW